MRAFFGGLLRGSGRQWHPICRIDHALRANTSVAVVWLLRPCKSVVRWLALTTKVSPCTVLTSARTGTLDLGRRADSTWSLNTAVSGESLACSAAKAAWVGTNTVGVSVPSGFTSHHRFAQNAWHRIGLVFCTVWRSD